MWCTLVNADYAWPKIHLCPFRKMRTLWMCYEVISKSSPFTGSDIQLKIIFETGQDLKIRHQSTGCSKLGLVCWTFKKKKTVFKKKKADRIRFLGCWDCCWCWHLWILVSITLRVTVKVISSRPPMSSWGTPIFFPKRNMEIQKTSNNLTVNYFFCSINGKETLFLSFTEAKV